ncbi:hypothetical protein ABOM_007340 [Aspergillus bombycis]|uniref:Nucleoside phosphorylase domain-containing protein n=1 Tax=Aspergillus bombycis TaxID=109264 RepID=A0A1F7ZZW6_9EURO|nr:hypothetical protein ABOM_007340 [Aspergillus bombycis]OGM44759.1 hypothetical protein ABOM_007340 [Aspergillus bombycis]
MARTEEKKRQLTHKDYTVAWVVVLEVELTPAIKLLDDEHERLPRSDKDDNNYILGQSGQHNVAITCMPYCGTNAAAHTVTNMLRTFPNIRFGLLVGIGGGVPRSSETSPEEDIRLGDVVVSTPKYGHGGVIQYDMGRWEGDGHFKPQSHLNSPPSLLLNAIKELGSRHSLNSGRMDQYITDGRTERAAFPGRDQDRLFRSDYAHVSGNGCKTCDRQKTITRGKRQSDKPVVHEGLIASGNALIRSPQHRDKLRESWDVDCFEMEAAGLMNDFPCLVIRGISDYCDSHKNDAWQPYAALTAAAYAKDLLGVIQGHHVIAEPTATEKVNAPKQDSDSRLSAQDLAPLNDRLNILEQRLQTWDWKLGSMVDRRDSSGQVRELGHRLETLNARLDGLETMISGANSMQSRANQLNERVLELETAMAKATGRSLGETMSSLDYNRLDVSEYGTVGRIEAGRAVVVRKGGGPTRILFKQRFDRVPHVQITPERLSTKNFKNFWLYLYNPGWPCVDQEGFEVGSFIAEGHQIIFRWLAVEIV